MTTGQRLRALRTQHGISQGRLARMARLPQQTISAIERDQHRPREITLRLLAAALTLLSGRPIPPEALRDAPSPTPQEHPRAG